MKDAMTYGLHRLRPVLTAAVLLTTMALGASPGEAQITAPGPYYVPPAWDQTLAGAIRFIVLSNFNDDAVLDRETGLVWERQPNVQSVNWFQAQERCNSKVIGGRSGWRLPTMQELGSLKDLSVPGTVKLPIDHPFVDVEPDHAYWTATTRATATSRAWVVSFQFADGTDGVNKSLTTLDAWCVRGGQGVDPQ